MATDTPTVETPSVPDKPRTFRAPDGLYEPAADIADRRDLAKPRGQREGLSGYIRLALRAYLVDADAAETDLRKIIGEEP